MTLRRLFWIGAAGLLGLAALISIAALLRGDFTETDGRILATLGVAFLGGSASLAGLALLDRDDLVPLGWTAVVGGGAAFVVLTWQIWAEFDSEKLTLDALLLVVALLLVATARLLHRGSPWLFRASAATTTLTTLVYLLGIHSEPEGDDWGKLFGTLGILTVLAWFLVPVAGRIGDGRSGPRERVVGQGPGRVEVDLAEGETLVVRS
jgi:hypothetical protein